MHHHHIVVDYCLQDPTSRSGIDDGWPSSDGKLLGAQAVGEDGVDKRIGHLAPAIQLGATVYDLEESELCYAPVTTKRPRWTKARGFHAHDERVIWLHVGYASAQEVATTVAHEVVHYWQDRQEAVVSMRSSTLSVNAKLDGALRSWSRRAPS